MKNQHILIFEVGGSPEKNKGVDEKYSAQLATGGIDVALAVWGLTHRKLPQ